MGFYHTAPILERERAVIGVINSRITGQTGIAQETGIPKQTVHSILQRLPDKHNVDVVKFGRNYVTLGYLRKNHRRIRQHLRQERERIIDHHVKKRLHLDALDTAWEKFGRKWRAFKRALKGVELGLGVDPLTAHDLVRAKRDVVQTIGESQSDRIRYTYKRRDRKLGQLKEFERLVDHVDQGDLGDLRTVPTRSQGFYALARDHGLAHLVEPRLQAW